MKSVFIAATMLCLATVVSTNFALAVCVLDIPSVLTNSTPPVSLLLCPAGDGDLLSQAWQNGVQVDATIGVELLDDNGDPIPNFPFEDIWMEISGLCNCSGSNTFTADFNTNALGKTEFGLSLAGGGYAASPVVEVYTSGVLCATSPPLTINFKSVDFNCDGIVNQTDVNIMKLPHLPGDFSADLDDSLSEIPNMFDAIVMAKHRFPLPGHACP